MDLASLYQHAVAAHRGGDLAQAEKLYREILRAEPGNFSALHMLGFLQAQRGRYDQAVALIGTALEKHPGDIAALAHYAHALMAAQRHDEALAAYDRVLAANPGMVEALYNRGVILSGQKRHAEALACFDRALALQPQAAATLYNRAVVLAELGRHRDALANYDKALALQPNLAPAAGNRAMAALNLCDWKRTAEMGPEISAMVRAGIPVPPLTLLGYSGDKQLQLQCAQNTIRALMPVRPAPLWDGRPYAHDKIRLAYISPDFREHAVAFQIAPLMETHDRSRFSVTGISTGADDASAIRARLARAFDAFHDFSALNDEQIARHLRGMEIDIAIDLGGHTAGARPGIFAWRPCPVQAAWLGYPATTGADFIDYLIADAVVAPFEHQPFFTERLVHLPGSFFPTDPARPLGAVPDRTEEGLPEDGFVFCCFNNGWKIAAPMFQIWMRLLAAVPGSVLWLKQTNPAAMQNLKQGATDCGVDARRLVFAADAPLDVHLARHALADLFLDTLPYNAHATAADALWAGLPVLTCRGDAFAGRVAASLLTAVELPELVTATPEDYEALALRLAREPAWLRTLKDRLARGSRTAPLFDAGRFRASMETALAAMTENPRREDAGRSRQD